MLRYKADLRTLGFMSVATALLFIQWNSAEFHWSLFLLSCLMAVTMTAIAHNHNHLPMWESDFMNRMQDHWITLFYGYPTFAWIPTHNANHHVHNNKEADYTATYKISENNNLLTVLAYPTYSAMVQQKANMDYLKMLWRKDKKKWSHSVMQIVMLLSFYAVALAISWKKALLYIIVPHQIGLNTVLVFNYVQHIHADEDSAYNHSRNIVSFGLNILLFNNGFHTVHHMQPKKHWSLTPEAHAQIQDKIDPSLNEPSFAWFMFRTYILSIFIPKYRTVPMNPEKVRARSMQQAGELAESI